METENPGHVIKATELLRKHDGSTMLEKKTVLLLMLLNTLMTSSFCIVGAICLHYFFNFPLILPSLNEWYSSNHITDYNLDWLVEIEQEIRKNSLPLSNQTTIRLLWQTPIYETNIAKYDKLDAVKVRDMISC